MERLDQPKFPEPGIKRNYPLLPLRDILVFPSTGVPLLVGREKSLQAIEHAMAEDRMIVLAAQKKAKTKDPEPEDIFRIGTLATIRQLLRLPDGSVKALVEGHKRVLIHQFVESVDVFVVEAEVLQEPDTQTVENEALTRTVKMAFDNYVRLNKRIPPETLLKISAIEDESTLADTLVAHLINLKLSDKQKLLEEIDPKARLEQLYGYIQSEIEIMRVEKKIRARVKRQMEKSQREYYLNEQMQAIQKELGEKDDSRAEIQDIEDQMRTKKLSPEAESKLKKEIKKLKMMSPMAAEATVVRNYIDTVLSLPWGHYSAEVNDIVFAESVLDEDHFGLEKVKERILEYLSIRSLTDELKGPILCLVGPPGVGKTSLAKSVARATGREFVRISLGGVRDESEIRGHRRTYIGSMPGKIIMGLKKAGTSNPVVLLDEIDKITSDMRGDPSAALLEVLDPAQNHSFNDHYLDLDYDLSKVLFLATANTLHTIQGPLRDRMEIISLSGYTEQEKIAIADQYLVPKQLQENGLSSPQEVEFTEKAIREIVQYYTREAGVRSLEREIANVCRKMGRKYLKKVAPSVGPVAAPLGEAPAILPDTQAYDADGLHHDEEEDFDHDEDLGDDEFQDDETPKASAKKPSEPAAKPRTSEESLAELKLIRSRFRVKEKLTEKAVAKYLGVRKFKHGMQNARDEIGICTGLAWTEVGGDILMVEVNVMPGKGKLTTTGKLGEVMQESAQAALSYVRSRANFLGLTDDFYETKDIHIHVPEGAIPKDGPSAGLCMATALTSALTGRPVSKDVAMTGEVTLRGRALPIGGLKEKVIAAHRGGLKKIIIPKENEKDIEEIPKSVLKDLKIVAVDHMDTVLMHALVWNKKPKEKTSRDGDELFKKLKEISVETVEESELFFTHH